MKLVDFHMHTTHSDGSFTPEELIRHCKDKGLGCISVTDHDTMSSYGICENEAAKAGIELVAGVEMSAEFQPGTLHILGYFLDPENPELKEAFKEIQQARRERNPEIIRKLNAAGIDITLEEVNREAYGQDQTPPGKQLGRPHFARVLLKKGVVKTHEEVFEKYLGKGACAYVDKRRVTSERAVALIRNAGGIASVAHPKQMKLSPEEAEREIGRLVNQGMEAIEVFNSCHTPEDNRIYSRIAKRYGLVETGGSDFHGQNKPGVDVGFLGKDVKLGYVMVETLRSKIQDR